MSIQNQSFERYKMSLYDTGLFVPAYGIYGGISLKETNYNCRILQHLGHGGTTLGLSLEWRKLVRSHMDSDIITITFDEVFVNVPDKIREQMIYHLDLLR